MAFDQLDEHEQSELVRTWMRNNAASIVIGIVLGLLFIFGLQQWFAHKAQNRALASIDFQAFTTAVEAKNEEAATTALKRLQRDYAESAYSVLASLRSGEAAAARKDLAAADTALQWAHDHSSDDALKIVSGLQLARVRLAAGKPDQALSLLQALPTTGYAAQIAELRGDVLLAQGKRDEARTAFQAALEALDPNAPNRRTVEMKRDDLNTTAPVAAETKSS